MSCLHLNDPFKLKFRALHRRSCTTSDTQLNVERVRTINVILKTHAQFKSHLNIINCLLVARRATYVVDGRFFAHFFWKVEGTVRTHVISQVAHMWLPYTVINV